MSASRITGGAEVAVAPPAPQGRHSPPASIHAMFDSGCSGTATLGPKHGLPCLTLTSAAIVVARLWTDVAMRKHYEPSA